MSRKTRSQTARSPAPTLAGDATGPHAGVRPSKSVKVIEGGATEGYQKNKGPKKEAKQVETTAPTSALATAAPTSKIATARSKKGAKPSNALQSLSSLGEATPRRGQHARDDRPPRTVPSPESGGIPNPTHAYLSEAFRSSSTLLPEPRRILVILDLNGTLLVRPNRRQPTHFLERPYAHRFLSYCVDTFHVAVWSSARPENVDAMVSCLLTPQQRRQCLLTWSRTHFDLSPQDYASRAQCYKRLSRVWEHPAVREARPGPDLGDELSHRGFDQSNTVLVDDSMEKGRSEPFNILQIPEFSGIDNEPAEILPQVHDYLNILSCQSNISQYMHQHPFKLDPAYSLDRMTA